MALGIPEFTTQLAALQAQFAVDGDEAALSLALRVLWTQYDSVLTLSDNINALLAIKAAMIDAVAALGIRGTVAAISELPAVAAEGDAYKLVNVEDAADGHLFARVSGAWVDLGQLIGSTGRSAYQAALALGVIDDSMSETAYVARPLISADLADEKAALADDKAALANTKAGLADTKATLANDKAALAQAAATAANLARDAAIYKAVYASRAALDADLAHVASNFGVVYDDAAPANNGTYIKTGASGAGAWVKLDTASGIAFQPLPVETGYLGAFVDAEGRAAWMIGLDGSFRPNKLALPAGAIKRADLNADLAGAVLQPLVTEQQGGPPLFILDGDGRIALTIELDGSLVPRKIVLPAGATLADGTTLLSKLVSDGAIKRGDLNADLAGAVLQPVTVEQSGAAPFYIADTAGRVAVSVEADGSLYPRKLKVPDATVLADGSSLLSRLIYAGGIKRADLNADLAGAIMSTLNVEQSGGAPFYILDAGGRIALSIEQDGSLYPRKLSLTSGATLPDGSSILDRLVAAGIGAAFATLPMESGGAFVVADQNGREAVRIEPDGTLKPQKIMLPAGALLSDGTTVLGRLLPAILAGVFAGITEESGYLFSIVDQAGRRGLSVRTDGKIEGVVTKAQLADTALGSPGPRENASYVVLPVQDSAGKWQLQSVRKSDGLITQLTTVGNNGSPALTSDDRVLFTSDASGAWRNVHVAPGGGAIYPVEPDRTVIACWGDSETQGAASPSYPTSLAALSARTVFNGGKGGQTSTHIAGRQGGVATMATVTGNQIPASGAVAVTAIAPSILYGSGNPAASTPVTIAGVPGTLAIDTSGNYTFTRTTAGSVVACPAGTAVYPDYASLYENAPQVLWYGRNNTGSPATIKADIAASIAFLKPYTKRFIILGVTNANTPTEYSGQAAYNNIVQLNTDLATLYGARFIDIRRYMIDHGLADAGITPTSQDLLDISRDVPPTSLMVDYLHFNGIANPLIAQQVWALIQAKGW